VKNVHWLLLLLYFGTAEAAATRDEITKEALARGYNTAEAQRRYEEYQRNPQAALNAATGAMANTLSMLAANAQQRMDADQRLYLAMYDAVRAGVDYPLKTRSDVEAMKRMLEINARTDGEGYRYFARKRLIEYALHLRPHSQEFFAKPDYDFAASNLRKNAYSDDDFFPWSALMLSRLYLTGRGVPQDDVEAWRLINLCLSYRSDKTDYNNKPDHAQCRDTQAVMVKQGWAQ